jgi:hypothetical protein
MRLLCPGLLWLLVGFSPAAAQIPEDIQQALDHRGHALLIGVSDYTTGWDKLSSVKDDLGRLKEGLKPSFETVETVLNATVEQTRLKIHDFLMGQWNKANERLLIYYSGHGFTDQNPSNLCRFGQEPRVSDVRRFSSVRLLSVTPITHPYRPTYAIRPNDKIRRIENAPLDELQYHSIHCGPLRLHHVENESR